MNAQDGPPPPLPAAARAILTQFRAAEDMPPDARARVRRALKGGVKRRAAAPRRSGMVWVLVAVAAALVLFYALDRLLPQPAVVEGEGAPNVAPDQHVPSKVEGDVEHRAFGQRSRRGGPAGVEAGAGAQGVAGE